MIKRILFDLLMLLLPMTSLFAKDIRLGTSTIVDSNYYGNIGNGILTTNSAIGFFFIIQKEIVEWHTISKTMPVRGNITTLEHRAILLNQVGTKYLGTFAQIEWKGAKKEFELERTPIKSDTAIERTISESPISITMDN